MSLEYEGWWVRCDYCPRSSQVGEPGDDEEAVIEELIRYGWGNSDIDSWTGEFACPTCLDEHEAEAERIERAREAGHILSADGAILDAPLPLDLVGLPGNQT